MSGVIDSTGQQWEHCKACGCFVRIEELRYEQPSTEHPYGLDLCVPCEEEPWARPMRRAAVEEEARKHHAIYEATIFPTVCGHGSVPSKMVYRFTDVPTGNPNIQESTCRVYCSETCAAEGGEP